MPVHDELDRVEKLASRLRDVELAQSLDSCLDELSPQLVVGDDAVHGSRDRVRVLRVEEDAGVTHGLGYGGGRVGNDRDAVVHGLEERNAEALVLARYDVHVGRFVVRGQRRRADRSGDVYRVAETECVDEVGKRGLVSM